MRWHKDQLTIGRRPTRLTPPSPCGEMGTVRGAMRLPFSVSGRAPSRLAAQLLPGIFHSGIQHPAVLVGEAFHRRRLPRSSVTAATLAWKALSGFPGAVDSWVKMHSHLCLGKCLVPYRVHQRHTRRKEPRRSPNSLQDEDKKCGARLGGLLLRL